MSDRIRILIVDDSAFARKVLREIFAQDPRLEVVDTARDGLEALDKISTLQPDVITLDLVMPELDGLAVLAALPIEKRPRVIVVSMASGQSDLGLEALAAGAFDVVQKPAALALAQLRDLSEELIHKVVAAAQARVSLAPSPLSPTLQGALSARRSSDRVVVVGASTGGPQALRHLILRVPADFPAPIAMVLHIPEGYTQPFAQRLDGEAAISVVEASAGLKLRPGLAIVARAGYHLHLSGFPSISAVELTLEPSALHRPSVDELFESAARTWGSRVIGVVLTGMGNDGERGARVIRDHGGVVLAEAESSCVVYGMPRAVVEAGLAQSSVPLERMYDEIERFL